MTAKSCGRKPFMTTALRRVPFVVVTTLAVVVAACSSLYEEEVRSACARQASAFLAQYPELDASERDAHRWFRENACITEAFAPGSRIDLEHIDRCTAALSNRGGCLVHDPIECVPPPGDRRDGESCVAAHQCESGYCYRPVTQSRFYGDSIGCGFCVPPPSDLTTDGYQYQWCPLGMVRRVLVKPTLEIYNVQRGSVTTCVFPNRDGDRYDHPPRARGGDCLADGDCAGRLRCVEGRCTSPSYPCGALVNGCKPPLQCRAGRCDAGQPLDAGCEWDSDCADGLGCRGMVPGRKCESLELVGQPCARDFDTCLDPTGANAASCHDGTCRAIPVFGPDQQPFACDRTTRPACSPCPPVERVRWPGDALDAYACTR